MASTALSALQMSTDLICSSACLSAVELLLLPHSLAAAQRPPAGPSTHSGCAARTGGCSLRCGRGGAWGRRVGAAGGVVQPWEG